MNKQKISGVSFIQYFIKILFIYKKIDSRVLICSSFFEFKLMAQLKFEFPSILKRFFKLFETHFV